MCARFALGLIDRLGKDIAGAPAFQQIVQVAADCFAPGWALKRLRSLGVDRDHHVNRIVHTRPSSAAPIKAAEGSLDFVIRGKFAPLCLRKPREHRRQMRGIDRLGLYLTPRQVENSTRDVILRVRK